MFMTKPTQAHGRFLYETGQGNRAVTAAGAMAIPSQNAWEQGAIVCPTPCIVQSIEAVVRELSPVSVYLLAYDVRGSDSAIVAELLAGTLGAARYTYGPIAPGGVMVREPAEVFPGVASPFIQGMPFDFGCVIIVSTTPRVLTAAAAASKFSVVVRGTTQEGCP